jgi:5-methylcytosine-specific restriction endonuclease McrA
MAKVCTKCSTEKDISMFGKDCTTKDGYKTQKESISRYTKNKEYIDAQNKLWAEENKERAIQIKAEYYEKNKEKIKEAASLWKANNPEAVKVSVAKYKSANKGKVNMATAKRRKGIKERTPNWLTELDYFKMECIYDRASELQEYFGIAMHVDHIIPLHGKNVSGFHCPENLQIVPAEYNLKKNNKYMEVA